MVIGNQVFLHILRLADNKIEIGIIFFYQPVIQNRKFCPAVIKTYDAGFPANYFNFFADKSAKNGHIQIEVVACSKNNIGLNIFYCFHYFKKGKPHMRLMQINNSNCFIMYCKKRICII